MSARMAKDSLYNADSLLGEALGELSRARDQLAELGAEHRQTMLAIDMTVAALIRRRNVVAKLYGDVKD